MNKEIVVNILNDEYKVIVCWGDEKFIYKIGTSWGFPKYDFNPVLDKLQRGVTISHRGCHPIIILRGYPKRTDEIATLAHEATHAVFDIFDFLGERGVNSEIFAHSVASIIRAVLKK